MPLSSRDPKRRITEMWGCVQKSGVPGTALEQPQTDPEEEGMPVWAWILIIVLLVLLLTGGVYVRR